MARHVGTTYAALEPEIDQGLLYSFIKTNVLAVFFKFNILLFFYSRNLASI
jgi:hypothetical protein